MALVLLCNLTCSSGSNRINFEGFDRHIVYTRRGVYPSQHQRVPIIVDYRFGEYDKLAIQGALDQWNYVLNEQMVLYVHDWYYGVEEDNEMKEFGEIVDAGGIIILYHEMIKGTIYLAWANQIRGTTIYIIRDKLKDEDMVFIMQHEIGHILGAEHNNKTLMDPHYHPEYYQCVDYQTMLQVARSYGLNPKGMNYCIHNN